MKYGVDPWVIADTCLLFLGILPGVIALGVDFGTGAWRKLDNPQVVFAPMSRPPSGGGS